MNSHMPQLQAPGAGLPWIEATFLKYIYFPFKLRKTSWSKNLNKFQRETHNILNICEKLNEKEYQTRALVQRLAGMEDSSRFWSVALTLNHLMITMKGMAHVIQELAHGREFFTNIGTADVKPKQEDVKPKTEMLGDFRKEAEKILVDLKSLDNNHSNQHRTSHPWFGPITSEGWVWVLAQHQCLHRKQIQMIVEQL